MRTHSTRVVPNFITTRSQEEGWKRQHWNDQRLSLWKTRSQMMIRTCYKRTHRRSTKNQNHRPLWVNSKIVARSSKGRTRRSLTNILVSKRRNRVAVVSCRRSSCSRLLYRKDRQVSRRHHRSSSTWISLTTRFITCLWSKVIQIRIQLKMLMRAKGRPSSIMQCKRPTKRSSKMWQAATWILLWLRVSSAPLRTNNFTTTMTNLTETSGVKCTVKHRRHPGYPTKMTFNSQHKSLHASLILLLDKLHLFLNP